MFITAKNTKRGSILISITWILANEKGNGKNTKVIQDTLYKSLSDEYQSKAPALDFIPFKGKILKNSIDAVGRIGR